MKNRMNKLAGKMNSMMICAHAALTDRRGEGYVDTAVKILMAVVIGALVLAGLYALFGDVVMPTLTERIQEMFDYAGYGLFNTVTDGGIKSIYDYVKEFCQEKQ